MTANIYWAFPGITEAWSFDGRLYMSEAKAIIERNKAVARREKSLAMYGDDIPAWYKYPVTPVYKIILEWEVVDGTISQ